MDFCIRDIDIGNDMEFVLNCHCKINYACETEERKKEGYNKYAEKWFSTKQPKEFYEHLSRSYKNNRSIIAICEINSKRIGYLWMSFSNIENYNFIIAEIEDIYIEEKWRKRGYGLKLMNYAENKSKESGANVLRSGTGFCNIASKNLHNKAGFAPYRIEYEKKLK